MSSLQKKLKVKTGEFVFSFSEDEIESMDIARKSPLEYNLIRNNKSVNAKVLSTGTAGKKIAIEVEGETFELEIKDELDQMLEIMGFGSGSTKHIKEIKAPMPGLVLDISVTEGQQVKEGDRILILEAMKMENSIMIQTDALIKGIRVKAGQAVDKGQVLVDLD